jgi:hypothetical protein
MKEFPTQQVLELACAAQRINGAYIKEDAPVYSEDGAFMYLKHTNKIQMLCTLDPAYWTADPKDAPMPLRVLPEDTAQADSIRLYYKRLLFSAIEGDNEFLTTINSILSNTTVKSNQLGYVACLPSVCARDQIQNKIKKAARQVDDPALAVVQIGAELAKFLVEVGVALQAYEHHLHALPQHACGFMKSLYFVRASSGFFFWFTGPLLQTAIVGDIRSNNLNGGVFEAFF